MNNQTGPVFEVVAELSGYLNYPLVLPLTYAVDSGKFPLVLSFHFIEMKLSTLQEGLNKRTIMHVFYQGCLSKCMLRVNVHGHQVSSGLAP